MKNKAFLLLVFFLYISGRQIDLVIVSPTYNNEKWCIQNIESVVQQDYPFWHMIIINDCSTDNTGRLIEEYIRDNKLEANITFISNTVRQGALKNIYQTVLACDDDSVIVLYDGDDWWANKGAFSRIVQEYKDPNTWMTYGSWQGYPNKSFPCNCKKFSSEVMKKNKFREVPYVSSHPRTFYAWLFKKIPLADFINEGEFFSVAWDLAIMFPLLEMSSNNHIRFISEITKNRKATFPTIKFSPFKGA